MSKVNIQSTVLSDRDKQMLDRAEAIDARSISTLLAHLKVSQVLDGTIVVMAVDECERLIDDLTESLHLRSAVTRSAADRVPVVGGHEVV